MSTQQELDKVYMDMAESIATLSKARRNKVGCVLVTSENVMLASFNGTPSGWTITASMRKLQMILTLNQLHF